MKRLLFILALIVPLLSNAAKIQTDEIDEFTGKRTVITSWESIHKKTINIRFRLQGDKQFMDFKYMSGHSIVIPNDGALMLKSASDDITKFESISTYLGGEGDGATGLMGSGIWGISATYKGDIQWFLNNTTILMRLYETDCYEDFKIKEKEGEKLTDLANLFLSTINDKEFKSKYEEEKQAKKKKYEDDIYK